MKIKALSYIKGIVIAIVAVAVLAPGARAQIFTYDSSQQAEARSDGTFTIGNLVQVGASDVTISALGVQDVPTNSGFAGTGGFAADSVQVGLWTADGSTLLASATVPGSNPAGVGDYIYANLSTSVTLTAGQDYLIGAYVGAGVDYFLDGQDNGGPIDTNTVPFAASSGFTILENTFSNTGGLSAPTSNANNSLGRWAPANALIDTAAAPEPSEWAMMILGFGLLVFFGRSRRFRSLLS